MLHLTFMCDEQSCFIPSRSLVAKDLDGDGNEDLVVGSPGYSTSNEPQRGRVYILYSMYSVQCSLEKLAESYKQESCNVF